LLFLCAAHFSFLQVSALLRCLFWFLSVGCTLPGTADGVFSFVPQLFPPLACRSARFCCPLAQWLFACHGFYVCGCWFLPTHRWECQLFRPKEKALSTPGVATLTAMVVGSTMVRVVPAALAMAILVRTSTSMTGLITSSVWLKRQ